MSNNKILTIDETNYSEALQFLCKKDKDLARVVETYGEPPMWMRPAGFDTLIYIILEQQVSLASAKAAFDKLQRHLGKITPENFLTLEDFELKTMGFSRQKTLYSRELAEAIVEKRLNLHALEQLPDDAVKAELTKIKGIGNWTAEIYLLMCLLRADVFPIGDLGVIVGAQKVKNLSDRPSAIELEKIAAKWKPYRAVATRILWHYYLSEVRPIKNS